MVIFEMRGCDILKEVKFAPLQVIPLKWLLYIFFFSFLLLVLGLC